MKRFAGNKKTNVNNFQNVVAGVGNATLDAWGRQKVITDLSLFHGVWTSQVSNALWLESIDDVEQIVVSRSSSENGILKVESLLLDKVRLSSKRHPRYKPNRGHLWSASMILPNKDADATRDFGLFTPEAGVFFRLRAGTLYAVKRTTVNSITTDQEYQITNLPVNFDIEKGNIYDIQMQWRGVGNMMFYIGSGDTGTMEMVYMIENLNNITTLSVFNPALPASFEVDAGTDNAEIYCGCVDISSEGGIEERRLYSAVSTSTDSAQIALSGYNDPVIAIRVNNTVGGLINTMDSVLTRITGYSDQRSVMRVWFTRDPTAVTATWEDINGGHIAWAEGVAGSREITAFDIAKARLLHSRRVNIDESESVDNPDPLHGPFYLSHGDILVVTIHRENGGSCNGGSTIEWGEEI